MVFICRDISSDIIFFLPVTIDWKAVFFFFLSLSFFMFSFFMISKHIKHPLIFKKLPGHGGYLKGEGENPTHHLSSLLI